MFLMSQSYAAHSQTQACPSGSDMLQIFLPYNTITRHDAFGMKSFATVLSQAHNCLPWICMLLAKAGAVQLPLLLAQ